MPLGLTPTHLIIILVIVLIVVGPGKLPETGAAIGKALRGFKEAVDTGESGKSGVAQPAPIIVQPVQYQPQYVAQPAQATAQPVDAAAAGIGAASQSQTAPVEAPRTA